MSLASQAVHLISGTAGSHGGISRYCQELAEHLGAHIQVQPATLRLAPLTGRFTFLEHLPTGVVPDLGHGLYHFTRIMGCALMLWRPTRPAVATVHDLGPLLWPPEWQATDALGRWLFRLSLMGLKRMDHLIAVSEATAASIVEHLGIPRQRISVVHLGVDGRRFRPRPDARRALEREQGIADRPGVANLLYVGSEAPRKNLGTLLEALALLRREGIAARLIKVGGPGQAAYRAGLLAQAEGMGVSGDLHLAGRVEDEDLALFYSAADVYVLASHVEGFGLPVLEAMACGTPVVCSNAGSLPEVAGDAALLVPPDDAHGLASAIAALLASKEQRQDLIARGLARSRCFTWEQAARQTAGAYRRVAAH